MSTTITTSFVNQYKNSIELLMAQQGSLLRDYVRHEELNAEYGFIEQLGEVQATEVTSFNAPTTFADIEHLRRKYFAKPYSIALPLDDLALRRMQIDPMGEYAQRISSGLNKKLDKVIIDAFTATAYTGKDGTTAVTFPAGNYIAVDKVDTGTATNNNLNIGKIRAGLEALENNFADPSDPTICLISPSQLTALLNQTKVTSSDYNSVKALVNGEVDTFMGVKFVKIPQLLPLNGSGYRICFLYKKSCMALVKQQEIKLEIDKRPDLNNIMQILGKIDAGAVRLEEKGVYGILCDESKPA